MHSLSILSKNALERAFAVVQEENCVSKLLLTQSTVCPKTFPITI